MNRKLKIYGTLGPSCTDKETLKDMFQAGMTGIRLNLSHCTLPDRKDWLSHLYEACDELHIIPDFLVDLQGPELRVGKISRPVPLSKGENVTLSPAGSSNPEACQGPVIPCPEVIFPYLKEGQTIRLDDGKIQLLMTDRTHGQVMIGGNLLAGKSIAIDGVSIPLPPLTKQDLETLKVLRNYRVTGVMQPFVRSKDDLVTLRKELSAAGMDHVRIFAKIETREGAEHIGDFLPYCDEIIIARGDLGNAIPLTRLPIVQKQIAGICRMAKKPFMVVTQMLASMEKNPVPTRAEVSDIANAVLDGASSIMLTGETAAGKYPVEAMKVFSETAYEALRYRMTGSSLTGPLI